MKTGPFTISVDWPKREESAEACAVRLARMLEGLAPINSAFVQWYKKGMSRKAANKPFCRMPPQVDELAAIVKRGQARKDVPRIPWPELGYTVFAWNGIDDARGLSFNVKASGYSDSRFFPNAAKIEVHSFAPENADLVNAETLKAALLAIVEAWDGYWGCVDSWLFTQRIDEGRSWEPGKPAPLMFTSGWMTYLSAPLATKIVPPAGAIVEAMPKDGLLLRATDEVFTIENPQHLAAADAIQTALEPLQYDPRVVDARTLGGKFPWS